MSGEKAGRVEPPAGNDANLLLPILGAGSASGSLAALSGWLISE